MKRLERRIARLREKFKERGAGALLVSCPENIRYLTGFEGEGMLVVGRDALLLSTDLRYEEEAKAIEGFAEVVFDRDGHLAGAIAFLEKLSPYGGFAFEAEHLSVAQYQTLRGKLGALVKPTHHFVETLRLVKDRAEQAAVREAARRTDAALQTFLEHLELGWTERRLALALEEALVDLETEPAFPIIVASGSNSRRAHATPGQRRLQEGDILKIDFGARWGGYCADLTRTYFVGEPPEQFVEIYELVRQAHAAAIAEARPGMKVQALDAVAREIITAGGYGEAFRHCLGHGVGLAVHERPAISSKSEEKLRAGMIITIEPGIYLADWGGVRIEDTVLITSKGCERLTEAPIPQEGRLGAV